ncbi:uncharacterized protein LOC120349706 [Nilaparvata lugens]|uniref:uncharacterized protein LOC120349706 n=1 Tax=Nilaparvata lugens TaxID=108931 RepID=UPI00193E5549|nr:uncharacterized protein LOC120349706 [Nilaparvata lugens]
MDFLRNYFIVLLILFVSVFHIKFTLGGNIYEGNSTVKVGEPFSIVCRLSLAEAVHWQRNNVPIGRETKFENPRHSYNLDEREENNAVFARLSVSAAAPGHAGAYRCHPHHTQPHHLYVEQDITETPEEGKI